MQRRLHLISADVADLFYDLLRVTLASFQRSFPDIPINLFDMSCGEQFRALEDERIDLGFVGLREPIEERGLRFQPIASSTRICRSGLERQSTSEEDGDSTQDLSECSSSGCRRPVIRAIAAG